MAPFRFSITKGGKGFRPAAPLPLAGARARMLSERILESGGVRNGPRARNTPQA